MSTKSPTEIATDFGTDARTVRKFLRSVVTKDDHPGKGARWALPGDKRSMTKLKKQFDEWSSAETAKKAEKAPAEIEESIEVEEPTDEEITELEEELEG